MLDDHTVTLTTREVEFILDAISLASLMDDDSSDELRALAAKLTEQTGVP